MTAYDRWKLEEPPYCDADEEPDDAALEEASLMATIPADEVGADSVRPLTPALHCAAGWLNLVTNIARRAA